MINLFILLAILIASLTGCQQTPYDRTIKRYYNTEKSIGIIKDGINYKVIRDYKPVSFKQLDSIPSLVGISFKHKPEVAVEHTYKCTLVYTICNMQIPNVVEVDTIYLYKSKDGRYDFCEMYSLNQQ